MKMTQADLNARWRERNDERIYKMREKRETKAKEEYLTEKDIEAHKEWDALMAQYAGEAETVAMEMSGE